MNTKQRFFELFPTYQAMTERWPGSSEVADKDVILAIYTPGDYSGSAWILFRGADGTLFEAADSHCSCNGLESWLPEKTTVEALRLRDLSGFGNEFGAALTKFLATRAKKPRLTKTQRWALRLLFAGPNTIGTTPKSGRIPVNTANSLARAGLVAPFYRGEQKGNYWMIQITDAGRKIVEEIQDKEAVGDFARAKS